MARSRKTDKEVAQEVDQAHTTGFRMGFIEGWLACLDDISNPVVQKRVALQLVAVTSDTEVMTEAVCRLIARSLRPRTKDELFAGLDRAQRAWAEKLATPEGLEQLMADMEFVRGGAGSPRT